MARRRGREENKTNGVRFDVTEKQLHRWRGKHVEEEQCLILRVGKEILTIRKRLIIKPIPRIASTIKNPLIISG